MEAVAAAHPVIEDDKLIKAGDHVVFDEHGDKKSLVLVKSNGRAKVGKSHINTGDLIGARWGSTYTLSAGSSRLVAVTEHVPVCGPAVDEVDKDNRELVDLNTSQALTADDIEAMKASGKGGDEIIEALCKHSTTFEAKTEFAQQKYKKRKARKYLTRLTLRRPTAWTVCQVMFDKAPHAVWNLRPDSLALLLSLANVGAGSRCLVLDNCGGLLCGAVAERLGGVGSLCCLGTGGKPAPLSVITQMNLGPQHKGIASAAQLADLLAAAQRCAGAAAAPTPAAPTPAAAAAAAGAAANQQQQQQQPTANGSGPQHSNQAAAATCAQEAAEGGLGGNLVSRSIPVVAAAAAAAASDAAAGDTAAPAAAAAPAEDVDDLDALYDKAAAGAAAGGKGTDRKRQLDASSSEAQQEQQGPEHKRQRQQEQQMQADAGTLQDTEMADAAAAAAADEPAKAGVSAAAEAAAGEGAAAAHGGRKEGRVHHVVKSEDLDQLIAGGFNSLIVAAPKLQPAAILQQLLPLMAPSSPFVVFLPWVQPLAEAMSALTASRSAVLLQLQESWLRPYQVLPGRTHPHMALTTGGTGGYILSGITVAASSRSEAAVDEQKGGSGRGRGQRGRGRGGRRR